MLQTRRLTNLRKRYTEERQIAIDKADPVLAEKSRHELGDLNIAQVSGTPLVELGAETCVELQR